MSVFEDFFPANPLYSLDNAYSDASTWYDEDFEFFWGLGATEPPADWEYDQWQALRARQFLAQKLAKGAATLVRPQRLADKHVTSLRLLNREAATREQELDEVLAKIKEILGGDVPFRVYEVVYGHHLDDPRTQLGFFHNCLQLEADKHFGTSPGRMADRMMPLIDLMIRQPGEFTREYLARVAACYIRDMQPEFAVMARAALDSAIQEVIDDDDVLRTVGGDRADLERRIHACRTKSWLTAEEERSATAVRKAGNDAIHVAPGMAPNSSDVLGHLSKVLAALDRVKT
jgi:uncharacterized protein DUF4145